MQRVLVMLDYGDGDPSNGEVFDLTLLARELAEKDEKFHHARVKLEVTASSNYEMRPGAGKYPLKNVVSWQVMVAFSSSGESAWLDDAVNAAMPTTANNEHILKSIRKTERKLEQLKQQLQDQRLAEAAEVRMKYPVCRITESPVHAIQDINAGGVS